MNASPPEPGMSVVTPVKGRVAELRALLDSLRVAARRCPEPVEVLVVDDSSPPEAALHRGSCREFGARYVAGPRHVGAKRNLGVELAAHDLVLFIDSDCRASPDLLARYIRGLRVAPSTVGAMAGPTVVEEGQGAVYRIMRRSDLLNGDLERPALHDQLSWATTCNLAVRKSVFQHVGGFVTRSLGPLGGEDVDLGFRMTGQGYAIACDPLATVTHAAMSTGSLSNVLYRLFTYGRSEQWLTVRYPAHRQARLNPVSAIAVSGVLAVAAARRHRGSLLLVPLVGGALLARGARRGYRSGEPPRAVLDAFACAFVEWTFDLGAFVAAVRLRRPDLLFTGFRAADDGPIAASGRG